MLCIVFYLFQIKKKTARGHCLRPFLTLFKSPNSEENEISLYIITTCSNIQVMRID